MLENDRKAQKNANRMTNVFLGIIFLTNLLKFVNFNFYLKTQTIENKDAKKRREAKTGAHQHHHFCFLGAKVQKCFGTSCLPSATFSCLCLCRGSSVTLLLAAKKIKFGQKKMKFGQKKMKTAG